MVVATGHPRSRRCVARPTHCIPRAERALTHRPGQLYGHHRRQLRSMRRHGGARPGSRHHRTVRHSRRRDRDLNRRNHRGHHGRQRPVWQRIGGQQIRCRRPGHRGSADRLEHPRPRHGLRVGRAPRGGSPPSDTPAHHDRRAQTAEQHGRGREAPGSCHADMSLTSTDALRPPHQATWARPHLDACPAPPHPVGLPDVASSCEVSG